MADSTTITIRISTELKEKLDRLATVTRRSKSFLAAEAVAAYVAIELKIVEAIEEGMADVRAGRVVSHEEVVAEVEKIIADAEAARKADAA